MIIHIDAEFKRLIPALLPDEFKQLESNILQDGEIKEPLAIWKTPEGNTLLDGHNRYKIAEKHNIKFPTTEITLTDRDHAKLWILNHQLGRRNLPIGVRTALVSDVARVEEEIRRKELATALNMLGNVDEKEREILDNLTSILLKETFVPIVENLRLAAKNGDAQLIDLAVKLFEKTRKN